MKNKLFIYLYCLGLFFGLYACGETSSDEKKQTTEEPDDSGSQPSSPERTFIHPGVTVTTADIERMRKMVAEKQSPAYDAYQILATLPTASPSYKMKGPFKVISRNENSANYNVSSYEQDFLAAYMNALMWCVTQETPYAEKALDIVYQYAQTLEEIDITDGVILISGFSCFHLVKAMEIIRYTYNVPDEKLETIANMLKNVFLPVMKTDLEKAPYHIGNQDAVGNRAILATAIYLEDSELYEWAKDFFLKSDHNGCIANYILSSTGQCQESGRDQRHTQLGLGVMAETCEIAHKQGDDDFYAAYDNLLLKGFEYTAQYNIGLTVPFEVFKDVTKRPDWAYSTLSTEGRGVFLPYYEIVYNHYVYRKKLNNLTEFTTYVLENSARPETYLTDSRLQHTFASLVYYQSR